MKEIPQIIFTFCIFVFGLIFFRSPDIEGVLDFFTALFTHPFASPMMIVGLKRTITFVAILVTVEWLMRRRKHTLDIAGLPIILRYLIYYTIILIIMEFGAHSQSFIYFQF